MGETMNISLFTLTDSGNAIAQRLARVFTNAEHEHRPDDFKSSVRQAFENRQGLVFVCATGIVIRTLAPLLRDKHTDPPVVVIDDKGQNVIPLLGGHEGGADILAREISEFLGANYVVTSATDYSRPVDVIGIGSDRSCPREEFETLMDEVSALFPEPNFRAVASIDIKADGGSAAEHRPRLEAKRHRHWDLQDHCFLRRARRSRRPWAR